RAANDEELVHGGFPGRRPAGPDRAARGARRTIMAARAPLAARAPPPRRAPLLSSSVPERGRSPPRRAPPFCPAGRRRAESGGRTSPRGGEAVPYLRPPCGPGVTS